MRRFSLLVLSMIGAFGLMAADFSYAQSKPEAKKTIVQSMSFDCTDVSVDYKNNPTLTDDEKLALMDQALLKSLSKFDNCQRSQTNAAAAASSAGGSVGTSESEQGGGSVATSDMTGQEAPKMNEGGTGQSSSAAWPHPTAQKEGEKIEGPAGASGQSASASNGKLPEDIPPADNDSVLEAQIRQAAINETDPEIKAKLWNEYRKYKGLPATN
jgi:hypothetical protein